MKKFKSVFSLLVAMAMVISIAPAVMAEDIAPITAEDIERYALGNADGRLIEEGMTVSYGNGTEMTSAPYLVDGFHYSPAELTSLKNKNLVYETSEGVTLTNSTLDLNTTTGEDDIVLLEKSDAKKTIDLGKIIEKTGVISLTEANNIIEFGWAEAKEICRLEMWLHPVGAVKGYKIQYFDGAKWVDHAKGELDQTQVAAADSQESKSATAYIMTFKPVVTSKLRFVATSFKEGVSAAKIAEAVPRSNNNVNLLAKNTLNIRGTSYGWLNGIGTSTEIIKEGDVVVKEGLNDNGTNTNSSPYAFGFQISNKNDAYGKWAYSSSASACYATYGQNPDTYIYAMKTPNGSFYYAVRFPDSPQKISKVEFPIQRGAVKEFEIWYGNDVKLGEMTNWKKATTVKGNFEKGSTATAYITDNIAAECWKIVITDSTGNSEADGTQIYIPAMYVLGDYVNLFGEGASIGGEKTTDILSDNYYHVIYNAVNTEKAAEKKAGEEYLAANEGATKDDADYKAYVKAIKDVSAFPTNNTEKFAKFTEAGSGIEWKWAVEKEIKRLELWMAGKGGIKDYEIQISEDGNDWDTVHEDTFAKAADRYTSYYPIIFNEPIETSYIRLYIKSFYGTSGGYISEAIFKDTNDINLGARRLIGSSAENSQWWAFSPYLVGYNASATDTGSGPEYYINGYDYVYPVYSSGGDGINIKADENGLWYATTFGNSKVKVNKLGVNVVAGTITKLKIYVGNGTSIQGTAYPGFPLVTNPSSFGTEPDAVIDCEITKNTDVLFELPKAYAGNGILVVAEGTSDAKVTSYDFYSVADYELTPIAPCDAKIEGTVAPNEELQFSVFSCNTSIPDAKVFFALYSNDSLADVKIADCAISGAKTHTAKYTVPEDATGTLSLKAFLWDGVTLKPILSSFVEPEEVE